MKGAHQGHTKGIGFERSCVIWMVVVLTFVLWMTAPTFVV